MSSKFFGKQRSYIIIVRNIWNISVFIGTLFSLVPRIKSTAVCKNERKICILNRPDSKSSLTTVRLDNSTIWLSGLQIKFCNLTEKMRIKAYRPRAIRSIIRREIRFSWQGHFKNRIFFQTRSSSVVYFYKIIIIRVFNWPVFLLSITYSLVILDFIFLK